MKLEIHPLFLLLIVFLSIFGMFFEAIFSVFCVVFHEFAHSYVASKYGYEMTKISLFPYGARLDFEKNFGMKKEEICVALAGPIFNLLFAIILSGIWWLFPIVYSYTETLFSVNMSLFLVNLLPCYPLDGGRILKALISDKIGKKKTKILFIILNVIVSLVITVVFVINLLKGVMNITFIVFAVFLVLSIFDWSKSEKYHRTIFESDERNVVRGTSVNSIAVSSSSSLLTALRKTERGKYNLIYVVFSDGKIKTMTEKSFEKLILSFPLSETFENILKIDV